MFLAFMEPGFFSSNRDTRRPASRWVTVGPRIFGQSVPAGGGPLFPKRGEERRNGRGGGAGGKEGRRRKEEKVRGFLFTVAYVVPRTLNRIMS